MGIEQAIVAVLGILASLVGALVYLVKSNSTRSDKMAEWSNRLLEQRDEQLNETLGTLKDAVRSFERFEREEVDVHRQILDCVEGITQIQERILEKIG